MTFTLTSLKIEILYKIVSIFTFYQNQRTHLKCIQNSDDRRNFLNGSVNLLNRLTAVRAKLYFSKSCVCHGYFEHLFEIKNRTIIKQSVESFFENADKN